MTVAELIAELQKMPQGWRVWIMDPEGEVCGATDPGPMHITTPTRGRPWAVPVDADHPANAVVL